MQSKIPPVHVYVLAPVPHKVIAVPLQTVSFGVAVNDTIGNGIDATVAATVSKHPFESIVKMK